MKAKKPNIGTKLDIKLKLVNSFLRSTMTQERLNDLAILSIESELASKIYFSDVINAFALEKIVKCIYRHF